MSKKPSSGRRTRRVFNAEFKAKVAMAALRQDKTMAQLCQQYQLHPAQINDWKLQLLSRVAEVFDNGSTLKATTVLLMLDWLGVKPSYWRPRVSDDNAYAESLFKTMKYRPDFPARFGCIEDARAHCQAFFAWYNTEHRHSGIGYMTPQAVHYGDAQALRDNRQVVLDTAFLATPRRFKGRRPQPHALPTAVWINPPPSETAAPTTQQPCTVNS